MPFFGGHGFYGERFFYWFFCRCDGHIVGLLGWGYAARIPEAALRTAFIVFLNDALFKSVEVGLRGRGSWLPWRDLELRVDGLAAERHLRAAVDETGLIL